MAVLVTKLDESAVFWALIRKVYWVLAVSPEIVAVVALAESVDVEPGQLPPELI